MTEWRDEEKIKPPAFFTVWVMNGERKMKGYWDPITGWLQATENVWDSIKMKSVKKWMEIPGFTIKQQLDEYKNYVKKRDDF